MRGIMATTRLRCKAYLQCLLFWPTVYEKGLYTLLRSALNGYYALVLRSDRPGDVALGQKASVYADQHLVARVQQPMP